MQVFLVALGAVSGLYHDNFPLEPARVGGSGTHLLNVLLGFSESSVG